MNAAVNTSEDPAATRVTHALDAAGRLQTQIGLTGKRCRVGWQAFAALHFVGGLDILLPLPAFMRGLLMLALFGSAGWLLYQARRQAAETPLARAQIARLLETECPELDNALIHAVQFGTLTAETADSAQRELMQHELARAECDASRLPILAFVERSSLRRERRRLQIACGLTLAAMLLFSRAYRFEVPRLLLFWQDNPPFTLTDFAVVPDGAEIPSGGSVTIFVRVGGLLPNRLELVSGQAGDTPQSLPLAPSDTGYYTAALTHLTADTWFYANGDTGRSRRYWIRIHPPKPPATTRENAPQSSDMNAVQPGSKQSMESLRHLAQQQAELAKQMAANAKQAAGNTEAKTNALREQQKVLRQEARKLMRQTGESPAAKDALQQAMRNMRRAQNAPADKMPSPAQQAAEQMQAAAQGAGQNAAGSKSGKTSVGVSHGGKPSDTKAEHENAPSDFKGERIEPDASRVPLSATDRAAARYPAEYRRLVRDYFRAVAGK